jgi:hypothetical protein
MSPAIREMWSAPPEVVIRGALAGWAPHLVEGGMDVLVRIIKARCVLLDGEGYVEAVQRTWRDLDPTTTSLLLSPRPMTGRCSDGRRKRERPRHHDTVSI